MQLTRSPFSSLAVRQSLLIAAVVLVAVLGFAALAIDMIGRGARADLLRTVDTDIAGLADINASGGLHELQRRLGDRLALEQMSGVHPYYRLSGADGRPLAGNLAGMPALDAVHSEAGTVVTASGPMVARATVLKGGATLVVGRSLDPLRALTRNLWLVFAWVAGAALLASLLIGLLVAGRLARRVDRLNQAFDRFDSGNLDTRAGPAAGDDEVAALTRHVDAHLTTIAQLFATQRQISDDIAHELRTPLVHLDSRLIKAIERNADPEVAAELLQARADIRSVVSLFDALLDIALAESAGASGSTKAPVDLSELAADVAELYAASAEEAGITFSTRIAPDVRLQGESMQLTRLIANLLDNALKYAPSGSKVRLLVSAGPRLVVEDDGPGVAPADRERIFQRFIRSTARGSGHGLGLALVRVIAARHGLGARVEDAQPGARFIIEPAAAR